MLRVPQKRLILASQSPARARLLEKAGLEFTAMPARIDEDALREAGMREGLSGLDMATALAEAKARKVSSIAGEDALILGSDQLLECDGAWFGKPDSMEQARDMLARLAGKTHRLITPAVIYSGDARLWHAAETPRIAIRAMTDKEIDDYINAMGMERLRESGLYQIEGMAARILARIDGCPYAALGLPLLHLMAYLRENGLREEDA